MTRAMAPRPGRRVHVDTIELDLRGVSAGTAATAARLLGPALAQAFGGRRAAGGDDVGDRVGRRRACGDGVAVAAGMGGDDERNDKTLWRCGSCSREGEAGEGPAYCGQVSIRDDPRPRVLRGAIGFRSASFHWTWVPLPLGGLRWGDDMDDAMDGEDGGAIVDEWA